MALLIDHIVKDFAEGVIEGIRGKIRSSGMYASGMTSESLKYSWDGKELIIYSTFQYITVLEDGRKPGKFAPPDDIREWVKIKINPAPKEVNKIAFLINRKLKENGSVLWQRGGKSGVLSSFINDKYVFENLTSKLQNEILQFTVAEFGLNR
jgi:hypothetical protein